MTTTNLIELRRLAEAATPGPHHIYTNPRDDNNWEANEAWHKAAGPTEVVKLLDTIEAQQNTALGLLAVINEERAKVEAQAKQIADLEKTGNEWYEAHDKKRIQLAEQAKQIDALQADLDWLQRNLFGHNWNGVVDSSSKTTWSIWTGYRHVTVNMVGDTFREAIAAARKGNV